MKILLPKESIATITLLMLLSLSAVAGMIILVDAAAIKEPTVCVTGSGSVELTWKSKKSKTYISIDSLEAFPSLGGLDTVTIIPSPGWGIHTVLIDDDEYVYPETIPDDDEFRLINFQVKRMISVTFDENDGVDDVDEGAMRKAYPYPNILLVFYYVHTVGDATAKPAIGRSIEYQTYEYWDIQTTAVFEEEEGIEVVLVYSLDEVLAHDIDPYALRLMKTDRDIEFASADVNLDGMVDGTDVSIVGNANPSVIGDSHYDPRCDVCYPIGLIDDRDVNFVNDYIGEPSGWEDITSLWEDMTSLPGVEVDWENGLVTVYGWTDQLCIFGIHSGRD